MSKPFSSQSLTPAEELVSWFNTQHIDLGLTMRFEQGRDGQYYVHLSLRNEVDKRGNYIKLGWEGSATYPRFLATLAWRQNLDFIAKGGSVKELRDPARWGRVVKLRYGTEVKPY